MNATERKLREINFIGKRVKIGRLPKGFIRVPVSIKRVREARGLDWKRIGKENEWLAEQGEKARDQSLEWARGVR